MVSPKRNPLQTSLGESEALPAIKGEVLRRLFSACVAEQPQQCVGVQMARHRVIAECPCACHRQGYVKSEEAAQ